MAPRTKAMMEREIADLNRHLAAYRARSRSRGLRACRDAEIIANADPAAANAALRAVVSHGRDDELRRLQVGIAVRTAECADLRASTGRLIEGRGLIINVMDAADRRRIVMSQEARQHWGARTVTEFLDWVLLN